MEMVDKKTSTGTVDEKEVKSKKRNKGEKMKG